MTANSNTRILPITRWLVYLIMGFVAFAGIALALAGAALPFKWDEAARELMKHYPKLRPDEFLVQLYVVFAFAIVMLGLVWTIMTKLIAIIVSVEQSDPFHSANAKRLRGIGWLMVGVQVIGLPLAISARNAADLLGKNDVAHEFSLSGILATLLVFILAGIFEHGAKIREELEGTI